MINFTRFQAPCPPPPLIGRSFSIILIPYTLYQQRLISPAPSVSPENNVIPKIPPPPLSGNI